MNRKKALTFLEGQNRDQLIWRTSEHRLRRNENSKSERLVHSLKNSQLYLRRDDSERTRKKLVSVRILQRTNLQQSVHKRYGVVITHELYACGEFQARRAPEGSSIVSDTILRLGSGAPAEPFLVWEKFFPEQTALLKYRITPWCTQTCWCIFRLAKILETTYFATTAINLYLVPCKKTLFISRRDIERITIKAPRRPDDLTALLISHIQR